MGTISKNLKLREWDKWLHPGLEKHVPGGVTPFLQLLSNSGHLWHFKENQTLDRCLGFNNCWSSPWTNDPVFKGLWEHKRTCIGSWQHLVSRQVLNVAPPWAGPAHPAWNPVLTEVLAPGSLFSFLLPLEQHQWGQNLCWRDYVERFHLSWQFKQPNPKTQLIRLLETLRFTAVRWNWPAHLGVEKGLVWIFKPLFGKLWWCDEWNLAEGLRFCGH